MMVEGKIFFKKENLQYITRNGKKEAVIIPIKQFNELMEILEELYKEEGKTEYIKVLEETKGLWKNRDDLPEDGVEYVNQIRKGNRLERMGIV